MGEVTTTIPAEHAELFRREAAETVKFASEDLDEAVRRQKRDVRDEDQADAYLDRLTAALALERAAAAGLELDLEQRVVEPARSTVIGCLAEAESVLGEEIEARHMDFERARRAHAAIGAYLDLLERIDAQVLEGLED